VKKVNTVSQESADHRAIQALKEKWQREAILAEMVTPAKTVRTEIKEFPELLVPLVLKDLLEKMAIEGIKGFLVKTVRTEIKDCKGFLVKTVRTEIKDCKGFLAKTARTVHKVFLVKTARTVHKVFLVKTAKTIGGHMTVKMTS
jgi:hypothetical protein